MNSTWIGGPADPPTRVTYHDDQGRLVTAYTVRTEDGVRIMLREPVPAGPRGTTQPGVWHWDDGRSQPRFLGDIDVYWPANRRPKPTVDRRSPQR